VYNIFKQDEGVKIVKKFVKTIKSNYEFLFMVLPASIWFFVFCYVPMFGVVIAFKNLRLTGNGFIDSLMSSEWVGLKNFQFLFTTQDAWVITRNTVLYNLVFIFLGLIVSVSIAIILSEMSHKFLGKVLQTGMFLPYFLSWVAVSYFVFVFLSDRGMINNIITSLGGTKVDWYMDTKPWPIILVIANLIKNAGYGSVIYLATIAGIDRSYYEAAMIDGASKGQQIKYITIPMLVPTMIILTLLAIGGIFRADFGLFYQVPKNSGILYPVTDVIDTYVYRSLATMADFGMSTAAGLYQSVVGFIMIMTANFIVKKIDNENALF
jgi:putative aldouronate transport system permease protein